ncbi:MAG: beta-lactamase family protein, partial [Myxococcales bacterium]|nr:beta-lactamase family protein [Myxococcales bacterium]
PPPPAVAPAPAPAPASAAPAPAPAEPLAAWVDGYARALGGDEATLRFQGSLLVARGERVVFKKDYGEPGGDRYRIGSVTKPFTAVAILKLVHQGKLSLDDSIRKHIPSLPETHQAITLAQILSHRSGLANYTGNTDLMAVRDQPKTQAEMLSIIAAEPLLFEPGTRWQYSNSGYFLLGMVVERVSGEPWLAYLKKHVFEPSGMTDTDVSDRGLARALEAEDGALVPAHPVDVSIPFSAGALVSTVEDLHRFAVALSSDRLLPASLRERMWQNLGGPNDSLGWGLGFALHEREGVATVGHTGGIDGFRSYLELTRDGEAIVVALTDVGTFDAGSLGAPALRMAIAGERIEPPRPAVMLPFDAPFCASLAGSYAIPSTTLTALQARVGETMAKTVATVAIRCEAGYRFKPVGQSEVVLQRRQDGALVNEGIHLEIAVDPPQDGAIGRFVLRQGGLAVDYERVHAP